MPKIILIRCIFLSYVALPQSLLFVLRVTKQTGGWGCLIDIYG